MPSFYYFKLFVLKELNSSKIIQINPSGIISTQSRTQQIMLEEGLVFVMMTKLKGGILDHSFFRNQREPGMTTIPLVNKRDPELKKEFIVCLATKSADVLTALENWISDWSRMVRAVALVIKFKKILFSKINQHSIIRKVKCATLLKTSLLEEAKTRLIKMVQQWSFGNGQNLRRIPMT